MKLRIVEKWTEHRYICKCDHCGNFTMMMSASLTDTTYESCGCTVYQDFDDIYTIEKQKVSQAAMFLKIHYEGNVCKRWHDFDKFAKDTKLQPLGISIERRCRKKKWSKKNVKFVMTPNMAPLMRIHHYELLTNKR
ncbi:MAG: hypothetical protein KAS32_14725 [Candidatus Peribacteraceae bacterium]|nr:hypothetical protein [Candidatus Peribacteraceae bacterium]